MNDLEMFTNLCNKHNIIYIVIDIWEPDTNKYAGSAVELYNNRGTIGRVEFSPQGQLKNCVCY